MKQILVTLGIPLQKAKKDAVISLKLEYYKKKLKKYKLKPVFVSSDLGFQKLREVYEKCHGVLFTGGGDVDARHYGEKNHKNSSVGAPGRDEMEFYLLERVFLEKKPFLGICRGAQVLAIFLGGKIEQHIPDHSKEQHGVSEHLNYKTKSGMAPVKETHAVYLKKKTRTFDIIQKKIAMTNSFHHQAIKPCKNFVVAGKTRGGIIELIEIPGKHFCFGVQSHPERLEDSDLEPMFAAFADSMKKKGFFKR
ncbi:MAG: gamma-glutamyl-gamma-aminobutyrate hydrolase family protein [Candidatus Woesearchaeota archaeon]|nr:gamma-glutamyl-gamma-aminobutyrate hydrolase family protein [Candidatus Woesearchaeota archaeon]